MKIGIVFPQTEFGTNPAAVRHYAQTAEELGYTHILAYDHVLGANPDRPGGLNGPYTYRDAFCEPFVLFSHMAAVTQKIGFATGVIILPQRQTALAAKQAATLDVLSGGRLRLGIGIGWNTVEYASLREDFHTRGKPIEEQVAVMRKLWTNPLVTFEGRWHSIPDAGINPLPIQQPIPIWFGGGADEALKRMARIGDGWMTNYITAEEARPALEKLNRYLREAGRSRKEFGLEPRLRYGSGDPDEWKRTLHEWEEAGANHLTLNTMGCGFDTPGKHIEAIHQFARTMGVR